MKKVFLFLGAVLLSTSMWAAGGIFEAWLTITTNDSTFTPDVTKGISLGVITAGKMDSAFVKVWKDNGTDIQEVYFCYKINDGEVEEKACQWKRDFAGTNNQEWAAKLDIDFFSALDDGDHTIEMWCKAKSNKTDCEEYVYLNNEGKNYKLTFTKENPETVKDTVHYVAGNFSDWDKGMQKLPYTISFPADSVLKFKQVRVITSKVGESIVKCDTTWFGQTTDGYYMDRTNIGNGWKLDGEHNVLLKTDVEGDYTFSLIGDTAFFVQFPPIDSTVYLVAKSADWAKQAMTKENDSIYTVKVSYTAAVIDTFVINQYPTWWKIASDAINMTRESCTDWGLINEGDMKDVVIEIDVPGEYTYSWDNKNHKISVSYPNMPQAIENIEATKSATKFFKNGHLYILRDEHVFDAQGKMIR